MEKNIIHILSEHLETVVCLSVSFVARMLEIKIRFKKDFNPKNKYK